MRLRLTKFLTWVLALALGVAHAQFEGPNTSQQIGGRTTGLQPTFQVNFTDGTIVPNKGGVTPTFTRSGANTATRTRPATSKYVEMTGGTTITAPHNSKQLSQELDIRAKIREIWVGGNG